MGAVDIVLEDRRGQPLRPRCRRLIEALLKATSHTDASVSLLLTSDRVVRSLNRRFRGSDRTTDVLAFPAGGDLEPGHRHLGEIAISLPTATRQARRARWPLDSEVALLVTHGFLHLLGYDHETDNGTMHRLEEDLLARVALVRMVRRALPWGEPVVPPSGRRSSARRKKT